MPQPVLDLPRLTQYSHGGPRPETALFFRTKKSGPRTYLQLVENHWRDGRPQQTARATLGRLDELQERGAVDGRLSSGARFAQQLLVLAGHQRGALLAVRTPRVAAVLIFERLWREAGGAAVLQQLLAQRRFEFPVERAVVLTVLHRLLAPGSDRAADKWKHDYLLGGAADLGRHHRYRAMAWLGEELPAQEQRGPTRLVPLGTKGRVEAGLFQRRRDLFTQLQVAFFDTTALYFEGEGGAELGQYVEVERGGQRFRLRAQLQGTCGRVFRAVGVAIPPTVQQLA